METAGSKKIFSTGSSGMPSVFNDEDVPYEVKELLTFERVTKSPEILNPERETTDQGYLLGLWYADYDPSIREMGSWHVPMLMGKNIVEGSEAGKTVQANQIGSDEEAKIRFVKNWEEFDRKFPAYEDYAEHPDVSAVTGRPIAQGESVIGMTGTGDLMEYQRMMVETGTLITDQESGIYSPAVFAMNNESIDERLNAGLQTFWNVREGLDGPTLMWNMGAGSDNIDTGYGYMWWRGENVISVCNRRDYGPFSPGAPGDKIDKHHHVRNADDEDIISLHFNLDRTFWELGQRIDAPMLHEGEYQVRGGEYENICKVKFGYIDSIDHPFLSGSQKGRQFWFSFGPISEGTPPGGQETPGQGTPVVNRTPNGIEIIPGIGLLNPGADFSGNQGNASGRLLGGSGRTGGDSEGLRVEETTDGMPVRIGEGTGASESSGGERVGGGGSGLTPEEVLKKFRESWKFPNDTPKRKRKLTKEEQAELDASRAAGFKPGGAVGAGPGPGGLYPGPGPSPEKLKRIKDDDQYRKGSAEDLLERFRRYRDAGGSPGGYSKFLKDEAEAKRKRKRKKVVKPVKEIEDEGPIDDSKMPDWHWKYPNKTNTPSSPVIATVAPIKIVSIDKFDPRQSQQNVAFPCVQLKGQVPNKYFGEEGWDFQATAKREIEHNSDNWVANYSNNRALLDQDVSYQISEHASYLMQQYYKEYNNARPNIACIDGVAAVSDGKFDYTNNPQNQNFALASGSANGTVTISPGEMSNHWDTTGASLSTLNWGYYKTVAMGWFDTLDDTASLTDINSVYFIPTELPGGALNLDLWFYETGSVRADGVFTVHGDLVVTGVFPSYWTRDAGNNALYPATATDNVWLPDDVKIEFGNTTAVPDASLMWDGGNNRLTLDSPFIYQSQVYTDALAHYGWQRTFDRNAGAAAVANITYGDYMSLWVHGTGNITGTQTGAVYEIKNYNTAGTITNLKGLDFTVKNEAGAYRVNYMTGAESNLYQTSDVAQSYTYYMRGFNSTIYNYGKRNPNIYDASGFRAAVINGDTGTIASYKAFNAINPTVSAGAITNYYGLYIENPTTPINKWAMYIAGGLSEFKDDIAISADDKSLQFGAALNGDITWASAGARLEITTGAGDILLDATGHTRLNDDKQLRFGDGGDTHLRWVDASNYFEIGTGTAGSDILLNAQNQTRLFDNKVLAFGTADASPQYRMYFGAASSMQHQLLDNAATWELLMWKGGVLKNRMIHGLVGFDINDADGYSRIKATANEITFNDGNRDLNFVVYGDLSTDLIFADASEDRVGINTATPTVDLDVDGDIRAAETFSFEGYGRCGDSNPMRAYRTLTVGGDITPTFDAAQLYISGNFDEIDDYSCYSQYIASSNFNMSDDTVTAPIIASLYIDKPQINTPGDSEVTEAATLILADAPSEGDANYGLLLKSNARVYQGLDFDVTTGKLGGLNNPTFLENFASITPIAAYKFAIDDYMQLGSHNLPGSYCEGEDIDAYVDIITAAEDVDDAYVRFKMDYYYANDGDEATVNSIETDNFTIPGNTPVGTHFKIPFNGVIDGTDLEVGALIATMITRIADTTGTGDVPTVDPFIMKVGLKFLANTIGSKEKYTKY